MNKAEKLKEILALLGPNGENWHKGSDARNADGDQVSAMWPTACGFCLAGAACRVCDGNYMQSTELFEVLRPHIPREYTIAIPPYRHIPTFNDSEKTTFADVRRVIESALAV